jgi:hypothetical protein
VGDPELSFSRASKVLWGFLWRSSLLSLPLMFLAPSLLLAVMPTDVYSDPLLMLSPGWLANYGLRFMLVLLLLTVLTWLIMIVAMRWTLNSRWGDFRLRVEPRVERIASERQ